MKIYTVYVISLLDDGTDYSYGVSIKGIPYKHGDRTWGWFGDFERAEDVVLNNRTDIFEYLYNYACIEEVGEGVLGRCCSILQPFSCELNNEE